MTFAGKYTKLILLHPEKFVDADWIEKHHDQILEELHFAANSIAEIVRKNKQKRKKK